MLGLVLANFLIFKYLADREKSVENRMSRIEADLNNISVDHERDIREICERSVRLMGQLLNLSKD